MMEENVFSIFKLAADHFLKTDKDLFSDSLKGSES
jgi:hypothetical protein